MPSPSPAPPVPARRAAAVVLARTRAVGGIEVFMVRRHVRSEFVPDAFVFPGGSVQPGDREAEETAGLCAPAGTGATALGSGLRVAALRELFEEAGVLLAHRRDGPLAVDGENAERFAAYRVELAVGRTTLGSLAAREGLRLATDALLHWAHWITPEALPKRFDTHFFLAEAPDGQSPTHDDLEVTAGEWVTPEEALARHGRGDFPLVFATIHQLGALTGLASIDAARERFAAGPPRTIMPIATRLADGGIAVKLPGEPGRPVRFS
jgi:8-oxo-dGTP pyrophosphatase MutT (NUDIX family)